MLILTSCSSGYAALGTHTSEVLIDGESIGKRLPVRCEQTQWNWKISTLQSTPGFIAHVQTGADVIARGLQIKQLGGFTGSFWDGNVGEATASIEDGTVEVTGTALGYYERDPAEQATAHFLIRTDC